LGNEHLLFRCYIVNDVVLLKLHREVSVS